MPKFAFLLIVLFITTKLTAQDLIRKVPHDATVVVTMNTKAVFDNLNIGDLNVTLTRLGLFDKINADNPIKTTKIEDLGIDLSAKGYAFLRGTDSVQYLGALIPLSNKSQFESIIPKHKKIEHVNSLPTIYSTDRTMRMSWDDHTLYILGGIAMDYHFDRDEIKERYGLLSTYDDYYASDAVAVAADELVDSVDTEWEAYEFDSAAAIIDTLTPPMLEDEYIDEEWVDAAEEDYDMVDSVLAQEEYTDDYYLRYDSIRNHNDSIKNVLVHQWVNAEMSQLLNGYSKSYDAKKISNIDGNTLMHIHADNVFSYYKYLYPELAVKELFGVAPQFNYGIDGVDAKVVVDGNKLKLVGSASLDKEMAAHYKTIYNKKMNPKFYPFLDKDILGFFSFNMNTEAYIKNMPQILERYYGTFSPRYANYFTLATTFFDVLLDEKAIGKVAKGDNLFVLNGVTNIDVTYTDYEYDEDYNYTEIEKTKTETVPQFIWMFSSDDTRIFEKLIQIGVYEDFLIDHDGLYEVKEKNNSGINLFFVIKNNIVFVGNDQQKMEAIHAGRVSGKGHAPYVAMVKKNNLSMLFNTKRIPTLLEELDMPLDHTTKDLVTDLQDYGNFYMASNGVKGNRVALEAVIEVPQGKTNALTFLFDLIDRWSLKLMD